MKKRVFGILLSAVCMVMLLSVPVNADTGPKPSVRVYFENMGDQLCYGTLLSETDSTGPFSAWDGDENHVYNAFDLDDEIWRAFAEYKDTDGFYYLQTGWKVSETNEIAWTYYPPNRFKILLYYPETDTFAVSGICEKYAFDSYYTVDMDDVNIGSVGYGEGQSADAEIKAHTSYNYTMEILSLIARIIVTIVIEMGVALLFGFRKRNQILLLIGVNTATQIILNLLLNLINYNSGQQAFVVNYILFEIVVFAIESVLYSIVLKKISAQARKNGFYVGYAFAANALSFSAGMIMARIVPGIF